MKETINEGNQDLHATVAGPETISSSFLRRRYAHACPPVAIGITGHKLRVSAYSG